MAFTSIGSIIGKVLRRCNATASDVEAYKVFERWPEIVGQRLAEHTKPQRIVAKKLFVEVDDPLWHSQLKYLKQDILDKIDTRVKKGVIADISLVLKGLR